MKPEDVSRPIPIPFAQRVRQAQTTLLPAVVFLAALGIIGVLWKERISAPVMTGQAEGMIANVSSHQPGVLAGLSVARFQKIKAGELIGQVMIADPKVIVASLDVIRSEIEMLRANMGPIVAQQRNAVDYAQLRIDWMRERAALAIARANLQTAAAEFNRTEELFKDKLVSESVLDFARAAKMSLLGEVEELTKLVAEGEVSFKTMQPTNTTDIATISSEPLRVALQMQDSKLRLAEAQLSPLQLRSPIDGTVTAIFFRSGESITPGQPIVVIAADKPTRIVGYLRQPVGVEPKAGATVQIRTRGMRRQTGTAQIIEVGAQLETLPLAMQSPIKLAGAELALPVNVSLPATLPLRPGELVDLIIQSAE